MDKPQDTRMLKVEWLDSNSTPGWHDPEDVNYSPARVMSVGYVIHEDDESVTLAGSVVFGRDYMVSGQVTIPLCCIVSMTVIPHDE